MTTAEVLSLVVSIISIVVAAISWSISHHVNKRMLQIEEKREQDRLAEQNTGKVQIIAVKSPEEFIISNKGTVDIEITDIVLNGVPMRQNPYLKEESIPQGRIKLPINNQYTIKMHIGIGADKKYRPPYEAVVKWITANGDEQQTEMTVNWV